MPNRIAILITLASEYLFGMFYSAEPDKENTNIERTYDEFIAMLKMTGLKRSLSAGTRLRLFQGSAI